ncbi:LysR family transcriptional regulator [Flaviaesturariibacter amylovorans]|uniref:LysR family transcriptional regulator n=1 Tax=Flaviaesturariibacter amylovorans TaxID=1084520 RepID=A0ABP8HSE9_9BACT
MNYTLNQLRIFLKVAETASITKAAEELHLSQPAVSIQLRNFQQQFDYALTETISKRLHITDFGREVARAAETILAEVHAIQFAQQAYKGKLVGRLKVSVVSTGKYVMPYFLAQFLRQNDGVELVLDVTNKAKVVESLEKNEVDLALVSVMPEQLKVSKIELMQNKLFLVGNRERKFNKRPYDHKILRELPLIFREKGSGTRHVMQRYLERHRLSVQMKMELTSNESVKQAVIAGLGYSVMPLIGLRNELQLGQLQIIPVAGFPIKSSWNLIWLAEKRLSPVAEGYLHFLREQKTAIIEDAFGWFEKYA